MKKRITYGLLAALMVCGCQEEELNLSVSEPKTFTAIIEDNYSGGVTKTSLDENGNVLWKKGNQVSIFAGSTINEQYQITDESDGKTSANLNRVSTPDFIAGSEIGNNVAFYPYSSTNAIAKGENGYKISVVLPSTQTYAEASFANGAFPMAAITSSADDMNLKFKNVLGGLKLQLKGTASIASISISGNNDEILYGAANVSVSTTDAPSIALTDASAKTITLDCGSGVQLNTETATSFIVALPPMTMTSGFTVIVKDTEGKRMEIKTQKSQTITRSSLLRMPVVNYEGEESDDTNGYEYVDLGLSVMWATCNVGASKPEEYGDYYAWGEIEPKSTYCWETYKWCNGSSKSLIKYNIDSSRGVIDNKMVLEPNDDISHIKLGGSWRIPTEAEWDELINTNNCSWLWTSNYNSTGVAGYIVKSKKTGYTDNRIFLPAAGFCYNSNIEDVGSSGEYWSSSIMASDSYCAYAFAIGTRNDGSNYYSNNMTVPRCVGQSVRPVLDDVVQVSDLKINKSILPLIVGQNEQLVITILPSNATHKMVTWLSSNSNVATVDQSGNVVALKPGTTTITITATNGVKATCSIIVEEVVDTKLEYVDLGLSVMWATCNVGASKPEETGNYYAWGEIKGYDEEDPDNTRFSGKKTYYWWDTYKYGDFTSISKYCIASYYGSIDGKVVLEKEDDAAYVNMGENWRMPTTEEFAELNKNCTITWIESDNTEFNGVPGLKFQSKKAGFTDKYIFLPASGYYQQSSGRCDFHSCGYYWTSSISSQYSSQAYAYYAARSSGCYTSGYARSLGQSIRPVYCEDSNAGVSGVSLNQTSATVSLGNKIELYPTVEKNNGAVNTAVSWMSSNPSVAELTLNNPYTYAEITALSPGTTIISAKTAFGGYVATCTITVPDPPVVNAPYVDLGLPSGILWAAYNIGASTPEEYGYYYAWGETASKASFSWSTYKHCNGSSSSITKYKGSSTLELVDDAAYLNWGSNWRMATYAEWKELQDYCTWEWISRNGVSGHLITSKNNGNSIFLPAAGYGYGGSNNVGTSGYYWTSSCSTSRDAYFITFNSGSTTCKTNDKYFGRSVRAVRRNN